MGLFCVQEDKFTNEAIGRNFLKEAVSKFKFSLTLGVMVFSMARKRLSNTALEITLQIVNYVIFLNRSVLDLL